MSFESSSRIHLNDHAYDISYENNEKSLETSNSYHHSAVNSRKNIFLKSVKVGCPSPLSVKHIFDTDSLSRHSHNLDSLKVLDSHGENINISDFHPVNNVPGKNKLDVSPKQCKFISNKGENKKSFINMKCVQKANVINTKFSVEPLDESETFNLVLKCNFWETNTEKLKVSKESITQNEKLFDTTFCETSEKKTSPPPPQTKSTESAFMNTKSQTASQNIENELKLQTKKDNESTSEVETSPQNKVIYETVLQSCENKSAPAFSSETRISCDASGTDSVESFWEEDLRTSVNSNTAEVAWLEWRISKLKHEITELTQLSKEQQLKIMNELKKREEEVKKKMREEENRLLWLNMKKKEAAIKKKKTKELEKTKKAAELNKMTRDLKIKESYDKWLREKNKELRERLLREDEERKKQEMDKLKCIEVNKKNFEKWCQVSKNRVKPVSGAIVISGVTQVGSSTSHITFINPEPWQTNIDTAR